MVREVRAQQRRWLVYVAEESDEGVEARLLGLGMQRGDLRAEQQETRHQQDTQEQRQEELGVPSVWVQKVLMDTPSQR